MYQPYQRTESFWQQPIWWVAAAVVVVAVGAAVYYTKSRGDKAESPVTKQVQPPAVLPESTEPAIKHPIPEAEPEEAQANAQPLPALNESDSAATGGIGNVVGQSAVEQFLQPENFIRRVVVTVDNLPRKKVSVEQRPVKATAGQAVTAASGDTVLLSDENYARYRPFIELVKKTDSKTLTAYYFRFYPLFQRAYEDLGYPNAYFNDRVIEVIDHLLATPEVRGPIELVQPKVFYEYADPKLEGRSAGQKLMIRMGPENAAAIRKKLREIRQQIIGRA